MVMCIHEVCTQGCHSIIKMISQTGEILRNRRESGKKFGHHILGQ